MNFHWMILYYIAQEFCCIQAQTILDFGDISEAERIYSYPNNFNEVGFMDQHLGHTIQHYLNLTFVRDGSDCQILNFKINKGRLFAELVGSDAHIYKKRIEKFLNIGELALNSARKIRADNKWDFRWRFFLSHGLPMLNHYTVQLMHFPPDYALILNQDHMKTGTTKRWKDILNINGATEENVYKFQTIVDILPIAAPGHHGPLLKPLRYYFTNYATKLLKVHLTKPNGEIRPLVVFREPARSWLGELLNCTLSVGEVYVLNPRTNLPIQLFVANHPSYLANAMTYDSLNPLSESERHKIGIKIMRDDLIAGNWQVKMGFQPKTDPFIALKSATTEWDSPSVQDLICKLTWIQGFRKSEKKAEMLCGIQASI